MKYTLSTYSAYTLLCLFCISCTLAGCNQSRDTSPNDSTPDPAPPIEKHYADSVNVTTESTYVYECDEGIRFSAYVTSDSARLFLPDTTGLLDKTRSASGAKYESRRLLYWSKGNEAILEVGDRSYQGCTSLPQEKAWESARLRGIDFRALGQEPGWILEIRNNGRLTYLGEYGQDTLMVPAPEPTVQDGQTIYSVHSDTTRSLRVEITEKLCTGAMSGFQHPYSVVVTVDDKNYRGCGRYLQ